MKKFVLAALVMIMMFITSCQQDLPPDPGSPGVAGNADYDLYFAEPVNFDVAYDPLYYNYESPAVQQAKVSADYVWHTGYYLSEDSSRWVPFEFEGTLVGGKWMSLVGSGKFLYDSLNIKEDEGVVLAYSCNRADNIWDCNGGKWMIKFFGIEYRECEEGKKRCIKNTAEVCIENQWVIDRICSSFEICEEGECVFDLPEEPKEPGFYPDLTSQKIETDTDEFHLYEDIYDVWPGYMTSDNLRLLSSYEFEDNNGPNVQTLKAVQRLSFNDNVGLFNFMQDEYEQDVDYRMLIRESVPVYNYEILFSSPVKYDEEETKQDFYGIKMTIQDIEYSIVDATADANGELNKLDLMSGDFVAWLTQNQEFSFESYVVKVFGVTEGGTECGVDVNGYAVSIPKGTISSNFPEGFSVGVIDILEVSEGQHQCMLALDASQVILLQGQEVVVNNDGILGSTVKFIGGPGQLEGLNIQYIEESTGDDIYLREGESWIDPVFGRWKILFDSVNDHFRDSEVISLSYYGQEAKLSFTNNDGITVVIPYYVLDGKLDLGNGVGEPLLQAGEIHNSTSEGVMLLYVTEKGETHVLRIEDVQCGINPGRISIADLTYGKDVAVDEEIICDGQPHVVTIGYLGEIMLAVNDYFVWYAEGGLLESTTKNKGQLNFTDNRLIFREAAGDKPAHNVKFQYYYNQTNNIIQLHTTSVIGEPYVPMNYYAPADAYWWITHRGSIVLNQDMHADIFHPASDTSVNAYVMDAGEASDISVLEVEKCTFTPMDCIDKASICSNGVEFTLRNNIGFPIELIEVRANPYCNPVALSGEVYNNEVFPVRTFCDLSGIDKVSLDVELDYLNTETGIVYTASGVIVGIVDHTCSLVQEI